MFAIDTKKYMNTTNNALVSAFQKIFRPKRIRPVVPAKKVKVEAAPVPVNVPITRAEMRERREAHVPGTMTCLIMLSKGPNRRQRRQEIHERKLITNRAQLTNNRCHPVTRYHVFLKMAHFVLALSGLRNGLKPTV